MTIINGFEIDITEYIPNTIKASIRQNEPLDDKLHVIAVISNPCLYARRYILMKEFIERFEQEEPDAILYIIELLYGRQQNIITDSKNPRHLQIQTVVPLWHKESMINVGINKLLPKDWKAVAWVDADLEFENCTWAKDTLRILNGNYDIVQLFSYCVDMDYNKNTMTIFNSAGYQYTKQNKYCGKGPDFWHPGYAWACTRKTYDKMGGLFDKAILGSGDNIMCFSLLQNGLKAINIQSTEGYKQTVINFQDRVKNLRFGYVPGIIRHHFHGSKKNRKYMERWEILVKYNYNPKVDISYDKNGLVVPTHSCPFGLLADIYRYFEERNEDEGVVEYKLPLPTPHNV